MSEQSGNARILARLRAGHDVTPEDFDLPGVVDGGKPIQRVAARIGNLKARGHVIVNLAPGNMPARYRLLRDAQARDVLAEDESGQLRLEAA